MGYDPDDLPAKWDEQLTVAIQESDAWKAANAIHSSGSSEGRPVVPGWKEMNVPGEEPGRTYGDTFEHKRSRWAGYAKSEIDDVYIRNTLGAKDGGTGDFTADDFGRWLAETGQYANVDSNGRNRWTSKKWKGLFVDYAKSLGYNAWIPDETTITKRKYNDKWIENKRIKYGKVMIEEPTTSGPSPIPTPVQN